MGGLEVIMVDLKKLTFGLRYRIASKAAKTLIPSIYDEWIFPRKNVVRPMTLFAKEYFSNKPIDAAEIGVFKGENAYSILKNLNVTFMFLIDSYCTFYRKDKKIDVSKIAYYHAKQILEPFSHKVLWIIKDSLLATENIYGRLDFIYIDANHDYMHVKSDIETYYNWTVSGGLLGGHNYEARFPGVIKAVDEFVEEYDLNLNISHPDWWVIKR